MPLMCQRVRYLKKVAIELVFPAKEFCIGNLTENKSQIVCTLCANYEAFQILYSRIINICCRRPKAAVSIVLNRKHFYLRRVETLALITLEPSPPTLVNLALAIMVMGTLGPPWQIPCRAASMERVIGYYWLLSSKSL
jgi:hypothetical protein